MTVATGMGCIHVHHGISSEMLRDNENEKAKSMMEGFVHWAVYMNPDQGQERHRLRDTIT